MEHVVSLYVPPLHHRDCHRPPLLTVLCHLASKVPLFVALIDVRSSPMTLTFDLTLWLVARSRLHVFPMSIFVTTTDDYWVY